ncbi:hypothetical protein K439DRAFT_1619367 [Ramaria rubella]|nr:hypothetical protein K439DRAFT_1619367 [Ramaria rubella]
MPACGRGRPRGFTANRTTAAPGRAKPAKTVNNTSGTKHCDYDGLDATNILRTKRERRPPINTYAQADELVFNESANLPDVPQLDAKRLVDDDYQDDGEENLEDAKIDDNSFLDDLNDPPRARYLCWHFYL